MNRTKNDIRTSATGAALLAAGLLALATLSACSTVSGIGSVFGGIGRDISDAAEGAREQMHKSGPHR